MFNRVLALLAICAFWTSGAVAGPVASGTISCQQIGPDSYDYSLTLSVDASSLQPVQSYWFAWIPGYDFLPSHPTSISSPAGWTGVDTPDTYGVASIVWSDDAKPTPGEPIDLGQTLAGFSFITPDPPSAIFCAYSDLTDPPTPVLESVVYTYPDVRGDYTYIIPSIVASVVPEPGSLAIVLPGIAALVFRPRRTTNEMRPGKFEEYGPKKSAGGFHRRRIACF